MVTTTLPTQQPPGPAIWTRVKTRSRALRARLSKLSSPAKPVLSNLLSVPLTLAGVACLDAAMFQWSTIAGLVTACPILIWLEHIIADEEQ